MDASVYLHEGVYNFVMAYRYAPKKNKTALLQRRYPHYLNIATKLFTNYHLGEAGYYFRLLNEVQQLQGIHKTLWTITTKYQDRKFGPEEFNDMISDSIDVALVPCGIFALEKRNIEIAEILYPKILKINENNFGITLFSALWLINKENREREGIQLLSKYISSNSISEDILSKQNFMSAHYWLLRLKKIRLQIYKEVSNIREEIEKKHEAQIQILNSFWHAPFHNENLIKVKKLEKLIYNSLTFFAQNHKQEGDLPKIQTNGLWYDIVKKTADAESFELTPALNTFINYPIEIPTEKSKIYLSLESCGKDLEELKSGLKEIYKVSRYYLPALMEELTAVFLTAEIDFLKRVAIYIANDTFQQKVFKYEELAKKIVFISYSTKDRPQMLKIKKGLEQMNITVRIDEEQFKTQENLEFEIDQNLKTSHFILALISPNSIRSPWVGRETTAVFKIEWYENKSGRIFIPVVIDQEVREEVFRSRVFEEIDKEIAKNESNQKKRGRADKSDLNKKIQKLEDLYNNTMGKVFERIDTNLVINMNFTDEASIQKGIEEIIGTLINLETVQ